jgi:hypothetical protein
MLRLRVRRRALRLSINKRSKNLTKKGEHRGYFIGGLGGWRSEGRSRDTKESFYLRYLPIVDTAVMHIHFTLLLAYNCEFALLNQESCFQEISNLSTSTSPLPPTSCQRTSFSRSRGLRENHVAHTPILYHLVANRGLSEI